MSKVRKPCRWCGGPKPPGERRRYCDACVPLAKEAALEKDRQRTARWYAKFAEKQAARIAARYTSDPEFRAANLARAKQWREENRERAAANRRRNVLSSRGRAAGTFVEIVDPQVVYERCEGICAICDQPVDREDFHVDHIVPLAKGGAHSYANTQAAHPFCNWSKGNRTHMEVSSDGRNPRRI